MKLTWKVLIGIIMVWLVATLVISDGNRYCSDGTTTLSSGSGTCSWHGGKGSQPEKKIANYILLAVLGVWAYASFFRGGQPSELVQPTPVKPPTPPAPRTQPSEPSLKQAQSLPPRVRPNAPPCPGCGDVMRLRKAKRGRNKGHYFWGCTNYPKCTETLATASLASQTRHAD